MQDNTRSTGNSIDFDPKLLVFLEERVNSFIKWDLIRFFHDNPHTNDTAENIARYTGRDVRVIVRELDGLVENGVIVEEDVSGLKIYRLTDDSDTRALVDEFIAACHDRQFRVKAIQHVISGMQVSQGH